ncbi:MAG: DUF2892 domain-containing protein [Ignavibacterium sp.]|nr:DUF2892 domain-containing protein [Ignavibacterium sp.]MCX7612011.1 DUF2892 domain-containing protein [Ignavibacterium sp.]MDW8375371.1 DUF2892 domain-containing protein [Ignavibacteriales bacterium]
MKANIGAIDKYLRILIGILIIGYGFFAKSWWGLIGIVPIITALTNYCPVYGLFKFSTNKEK